MTIAAVGIVLASAACTRHEVPAEVKPVGVATVEVRPQSLASAQRYSATLDAAENVPLGFATLGTVKKVYVREGQHMGKGTLLAEVDNEQARSAYAAAKATLDQAEDAYQRTKPLYEKGVIAKIKWIDIETKMQQAASAEAIARRALGDTRLTSPCAGYVADLGIEPGQQVVAGVPAMRIVNPDRIKAEFSVPEREVAKFGVGMPLLLSVAALDGGLYEATVSEVGMVADRLSRTYKVCATLPNADHALRVGMLGGSMVRWQ